MTSTPIDTLSLCRLCDTNPTSPYSHIIPKHVARAIKKHAKIKSLRETGNRKPVQDTVSLPFLCKECEKRFGKVEDSLARNVIIPLLDGSNDVQLDSSSRIAITSISWRVLRYLLEFNPNEFSFHLGAAQAAEVALRNHLMHPDNAPPRTQYLFVCEEINNDSGIVSSDTIRFSIGMDPVIFLEESFMGWLPLYPFVLSKMGPLIVFCDLLPSNDEPLRKNWPEFLLSNSRSLSATNLSAPHEISRAVIGFLEAAHSRIPLRVNVPDDPS